MHAMKAEKEQKIFAEIEKVPKTLKRFEVQEKQLQEVRARQFPV